jgi:hypothetical protein
LVYTSLTGTATTLFSQGDIQVKMANQTFDIQTSLYGVVDKRTNQRSVEITWTPTGELTTAMAGVLWPHGGKNPGDSLFGGEPSLATYPSLQIIPKTGYSYTFYGAVVTKQPTVQLSSTKTIVGSITFTAIGKEGVLWSTANSLYTEASTSFGTYAFSPASIRTTPYVGGWGATASYSVPTWTLTGSPNLPIYDTKDGWSLNFNVSTTPVEADEYGIVDFTVGDNVATATCSPLTLSETTLTAILNLQGAGADRGQSLLSGNLLSIVPSNGTPVGSANVTLNNCSMLQIGYDYGLNSTRVPQIQFTTLRYLVTNALQPAYTITAN